MKTAFANDLSSYFMLAGFAIYLERKANLIQTQFAAISTRICRESVDCFTYILKCSEHIELKKKIYINWPSCTRSRTYTRSFIRAVVRECDILTRVNF